jgi:hypothetical protein
MQLPTQQFSININLLGDDEESTVNLYPPSLRPATDLAELFDQKEILMKKMVQKTKTQNQRFHHRFHKIHGLSC